MDVIKFNDYETLKFHECCGEHKLSIRDYDWDSYRNVPMLVVVESFIHTLNEMNSDEYLMTTNSIISCNGINSISYTHIPERLRETTYSTFCGIAYTVLLQSAMAKDVVEYTTGRTELVRFHFLYGYKSSTRDGIMVSLLGLKDELQRFEQ